MEQKILKLLGAVLVIFIAIDLAFQIAEQLGTTERAIACSIAIVLMAGFPIIVLRAIFGPGTWIVRGFWPILTVLVFCFGIPLVIQGMQGTLDGSAAAALVLLPAFFAIAASFKGIGGGPQ